MKVLLSVKQLGYETPNRRPLVTGLNFDLYAGDVLTITGPNGVGKSTLLQTLAGLRSNRSEGSIVWHVSAHKRELLTQLHNQEFHIPLTLADVLSFGRHPFETKVVEDIGLLNAQQLSLAWNTASGGERQKTLLTMLLLKEPDVVMLDEPLNHLDQSSRERIYAMLRSYVALGSRAVIMVCHETSLKADWVKKIDLNAYAYR